MFDPVLLVAMIAAVVGLDHVTNKPCFFWRLLITTLPGVLIIYYVEPWGLWFALCMNFLCYAVFIVCTRTNNKTIRNLLPYGILAMVFIPDIFRILAKDVYLLLGSAFYVVRQFVTLKEAIKHKIAFSSFVPGLALATFFFPSIFVGPIFDGNKVLHELTEDKAGNYREGLFALLEGFVFLVPVSQFLGTGISELMLRDYTDSGQLELFVVFKLLVPTLGFMVIFSTFFGYSRIAEGTANLLGFSVPQNFNKPHLAKDFADFWKRWHRSMADFVMKYIYLPLSIRTRRPRLALIITFVFMGSWHTLSWGYLVWGLSHGVAIALLLPLLRKMRVPAGVMRLITLFFVVEISYVAHAWLAT